MAALSPTSTSDSSPLRFRNFASFVDYSFFQELSRLKLDKYRLSDEPIPIEGYYTVARAGEVPRMRLGAESFAISSTIATVAAAAQSPQSLSPPTTPAPQATAVAPECRAPGKLINVNTEGDFKAIDKNACLQGLGNTLWEDIKSGRAVQNPALLTSFQVISFADLKRHHFLYWFGFPALVFPRSSVPLLEKTEPLSQCLEPGAVRALRRGLRSLRRDAASARRDAHHPPFFVVVPGSSGSGSSRLRVLPLAAWDDLSAADRARAMFGFLDPCGLRGSPGWPLRNFLMLLVSRWGLARATVVCYRGVVRHLEAPRAAGNEQRGDEAEEEAGDDADDDDDGEEDTASVVLFLRLGSADANTDADGSSSSSSGGGRAPTTIGWEANRNGKMGPRRMDLSSLMDAAKLAEASADLNLKLMRWRAIPALDTSLLQGTRCLLLGAGTLGCSVARTLLGWGVRHMTFVDNGRVSYSNLARQALYEFADCADGGKPKAQAAAEAMRRIYPGVVTAGHALTIPMPGHSVESELSGAREATAKLDELVRAHDVVYLLTDTRESRWLPTLLCSTHDRCLLDVALGMDSYLVMRHGAGAFTEQWQAAGGNNADISAPPRLGCYFCADVVAPRDSTRDRTLDQQCTVTRPGLAPMSAALAVELMVALLHHPERHHAPADEKVPPMSHAQLPDKPLGLLPHQLRGYLSTFGMIQPLGHAFAPCTACSPAVCQLYVDRGFEFVRECCKDATYLEGVSGLTAFHAATEARLEELEDDFGSEDDF